MVKLSTKTLPEISKVATVPGFDRSQLQPGIVHVGVGNFHRAHQAVYLNELLNLGGDPAWGIRGAGVRAPDALMRSQLAEQDWLYSVVEVDHDDLKATVIGSMIDFLPVHPADNAPIINAMSNPETRIVSLTVTEGGYFVDSATGTFDLTHPAVKADIATPGQGQTIFGAIVTALAARRVDGVAPFTVMSCDNLPGNGDATRDAVHGIAEAINPDLKKWIAEHVTFPNAMVDRITPATGERERRMLSQFLEIEDNSPVFCEPFRQWVLEEKFANGRPDLETVGVTFTDDIHDFEKMKIRILNGGHAILAYPAAMLAVEFAHDAIATPFLRDFLRKVIEDDVLEFVPAVSGFSPPQYLDLICGRVANPGVADTIARLCFDGSNRQPKFTIPSIRDNLVAGKVPVGLALSAALWCRYCAGRDDAGAPIADNDPNWSGLQSVAIAAQSDPAVWLDQTEIYGDVGTNAAFREVFSACLTQLQNIGAEAAIRRYLDGYNMTTGSIAGQARR